MRYSNSCGRPLCSKLLFRSRYFQPSLIFIVSSVWSKFDLCSVPALLWAWRRKSDIEPADAQLREQKLAALLCVVDWKVLLQCGHFFSMFLRFLFRFLYLAAQERLQKNERPKRIDRLTSAATLVTSAPHCLHSTSFVLVKFTTPCSVRTYMDPAGIEPAWSLICRPSSTCVA